MQTTSYKQALINFLNENLQAASICLKTTPANRVAYTANDVLGFPAAVLMLSTADAIGTVFKKTQPFEILFENEKTRKNKLAEDLYSAYRNPFLHNNLLLEGRYLIYNISDTEPFIIKNDKVVAINLFGLLNMCEQILKRFENEVTEEMIKNTKDIKNHIDNRALSPILDFFQNNEKKARQLQNFGSSEVIRHIKILSGAPLSGHVGLPKTTPPKRASAD